MAIANNRSEAYASATGPEFSLFNNSEWLISFFSNSELLKLFAGNPAKLQGVWNEALGLTASRLQEQADYAKALSECADPAEALRYSAEFVQNAWKNSYRDGSKLFQASRTSLSSAAQGK